MPRWPLPPQAPARGAGPAGGSPTPCPAGQPCRVPPPGPAPWGSAPPALRDSCSALLSWAGRLGPPQAPQALPGGHRRGGCPRGGCWLPRSPPPQRGLAMAPGPADLAATSQPRPARPVSSQPQTEPEQRRPGPRPGPEGHGQAWLGTGLRASFLLARSLPMECRGYQPGRGQREPQEAGRDRGSQAGPGATSLYPGTVCTRALRASVIRATTPGGSHVADKEQGTVGLGPTVPSAQAGV